MDEILVIAMEDIIKCYLTAQKMTKNELKENSEQLAGECINKVVYI